ncbi:Dynactin, isoform [Elsinoe australis]|uniref:Dynactin, isoform n=1 Tax=Elsinoe australis TaxID=40998 RepID=A0A2P7ZZY7_9PEZI|nr:Dynactin, isoform [Elsinoe australis]
MSADRKSRSWSRTRSIDSDTEKSGKRRSKDLRRSIDYGRSSRHSLDVNYQRFVLTDPIAFRYLEDDSSVTVLDNRRELSGYQSYIVEQWATSRTHPTFTITTYTGDNSDRIIASVLGIPRDESTWSQRLKVYFKALNHFHARRRDTADGILMVTSLPGFPSSLTVIQVPEGDVSKHYADFFVNEDLKRLGCSGRVGLTLAYPNGATVAKYYQLYRTHERISLYSSVIELVRICQMSLHMFDLLDNDFLDGLLCDVTEKAIVQWWSKFGSEVYSTEPHDGILGPSSVAGLIGLYVGARNRLHALGAPVPKDAFDLEQMKRGVSNFQKSYRLPKSRRLDVTTLFKLHALTEKAANTEGWRLPRAVKTTVAELSGRGEEMVQEGTGRKAKAGIADIETMDIETFEQLVSGERCRWLWQGKALKRTNTATLGEASLEGLVATTKNLPAEEIKRKPNRLSDGAAVNSTDEAPPDSRANRASMEEPRSLPRQHTHREAAARKVHGVFDDGRTSIDRLRGAVNIHKRPLEPEHQPTNPPLVPRSDPKQSREPGKRPPPVRSYTSPVSSPSRSLTSPHGPPSSRRSDVSPVRTPLDRPMTSIYERRGSFTMEASRSLNDALKSPEHRRTSDKDDIPQVIKHIDESVPNSPEYHGVNLDEALPVPETVEEDVPPSLRRTHSESMLPSSQQSHSEEKARAAQHQLSFSIAEASMFSSNETAAPELTASDDHEVQYLQQRFYAQHLKVLRASIAHLSQNEATWTTTQIDALGSQLRQAGEDQEKLREYYDGPAQAAQNLRDMATAVLRDEQDMLGEGKRELETLAAKLDYEIANLRGKIEDVELGVDDFERAVLGAEQRVDEVEREVEGKAGWGCIVS